MASLFAYGSLMFIEVVRAVTGRSFQTREPAIAHGFSRRLIQGETFPGIIPSPGQQTSGVLHLGLDDEAIRRVDRFESDYYARQLISVRLPDGEVDGVYAYVVRPEHAARLSREPWDREQFRVQHLERFISEYTSGDDGANSD